MFEPKLDSHRFAFHRVGGIGERDLEAGVLFFLFVEEAGVDEFAQQQRRVGAPRLARGR